jgi:hypothetical protein
MNRKSKVEYELRTSDDDEKRNNARFDSKQGDFQNVEGSSPDEAIQQPDQTQSPTHGIISPDAPPVEDLVQAKLLSSHERGENNKNGRTDIKDYLKEDDLQKDLEGR